MHKENKSYRQGINPEHFSPTNTEGEHIFKITNTTIMRIAVAGTGYVGLSIATLLSQHNEVVAVDVVPEKVEKINNQQRTPRFWSAQSMSRCSRNWAST